MGTRVKEAVPTRGERNIAWIERNCRIPEGRFVGKPVKLRPWQRKEVKRIYDNPAGTRRAILSFGRKNAKTTLSAFLLLLHLCGKEARANSQLYSAAQSREQAALLFGLAAKVVRLSPDLSGVVKIRDTAKQLYVEELGTLYRALSAEASTAYGLSPVFIVHDELGQVKGPRSELYDALESATGAQEDPLSIIISTQAPTDGDLLSILIDDAVEGHDPKVIVSLYTANPALDPFAEDTIKAANPAYGDFLNAEEVRGMAEDARRMPSREPSYRNLVLNQRVEMNNPFVSKGVWESCGGEVLEDFRGLPVYAGLDLSSVNDLTALVLIAPLDGVWQVKPIFWLPETGLAERSAKDRVPYDTWHKQGHLEVTPGRTVEYEYIAHKLRELFDELDIMNVAFDRWNFKHLKRELVRVGFHEDDIEERFTEFGQGFASMSPALRTLESDLLNGKIMHGNNPVLTMCAANAVVQSDPSGNRKLAKDKSSGRIDGMVSLAMARSVASTAEVSNRHYVSGRIVVI
jgi:phage terminase large subunit-like protein